MASPTSPPGRPPPASRLTSARDATAVAFIVSGFAFASWAARIPQVRDRLHLRPSELGLVLLSIAAGSVIALPLAGPLVTRLGSRRTVGSMALLLAVGLGIAAVGYRYGLPPLVLGLFLLGLANGAWDVAMNVQAALVEQHLGRSIMPRFHAGWSVGTVAGAAIGALLVALRVPVTAHLCTVAVLVAVVVPLAVRQFLPDETAVPGAADAVDEPGGSKPGVWAAWTERRTLLIGLFVLAFAFTEGAGNDWISIALIDGYGLPAALGTLGFAVFLAAMTTGRWFGPALLDRLGRVRALRALTVFAVVGVATFVLGATVGVAFVAVGLWGVGTSLGFPVGMSAGADDPSRAAARVSVISSIGYCAFLGGPPLIGFIGEESSVLRALSAVGVLLALVALIAGNLRPLPRPEVPAAAPPARAEPAA